jgi:hypothetical protein
MVGFDRIVLCHDKLASMPPVLYITSWCGASIKGFRGHAIFPLKK